MAKPKKQQHSVTSGDNILELWQTFAVAHTARSLISDNDDMSDEDFLKNVEEMHCNDSVVRMLASFLIAGDSNKKMDRFKILCNQYKLTASGSILSQLTKQNNETIDEILEICPFDSFDHDQKWNEKTEIIVREDNPYLLKKYIFQKKEILLSKKQLALIGNQIIYYNAKNCFLSINTEFMRNNKFIFNALLTQSTLLPYLIEGQEELSEGIAQKLFKVIKHKKIHSYRLRYSKIIEQPYGLIYVRITRETRQELHNFLVPYLPTKIYKQMIKSGVFPKELQEKYYIKRKIFNVTEARQRFKRM